MDRWTDGQMDRWTDKRNRLRTDGYAVHVYTCIFLFECDNRCTEEGQRLLQRERCIVERLCVRVCVCVYVCMRGFDVYVCLYVYIHTFMHVWEECVLAAREQHGYGCIPMCVLFILYIYIYIYILWNTCSCVYAKPACANMHMHERMEIQAHIHSVRDFSVVSRRFRQHKSVHA